VGNQVDAPAGRSLVDAGFGRLFWRMQEAAILADPGTGRILLWNPGAARMFGYTEAEAIGMPIETLVTDRYKYGITLGHDSRAGLEAPIDRATVVELPVRHQDGSTFWAQMSVSPLEDGTLGRGLALAIIREVRPRKRAETVPESRIRASIAAMGVEIGGALADRSTLDEALHRVADALVRHLCLHRDATAAPRVRRS
jgi:PAS domain S-box-containing protein